MPGRQEALLAAGSACVDAKEYDKAMALYEDALKDGMEHGEIYNQMGLCQMAAEDYQSAYDSFDKGYQVAAAAQAAALQEKDLSLIHIFLAVLELMKIGKIHLSQEETFGDMDIETLEQEGEEEELDLAQLGDFEG